MPARRSARALARLVLLGLKPNQKLRLTRNGQGYLVVWAALLGVGLYQQSNLILLISGLAAGPLVASVFVSAGMLRRLNVERRPPQYVFAGEPLEIDYTLQNDRRWAAALAMELEDELVPADRITAANARVETRVMFPRVGGREKQRERWAGTAPARGRYKFGDIELATRSPFGLVERRVILNRPDEFVVYPRVGRLTRRWAQIHREATETKRGRRHDRTAQQLEYHGLRDYRAGDSPRWIHWRTTARVGVPMVKEFEQQSDQDVAVLLDPWLPRTKVTADQRETLEALIRFAATLCMETCRKQGRRLVVGWTGTAPGLIQGPASIKLLHEILRQLAVLRGAGEGQVSGLLDVLPPAVYRDALLVIASTRPVHLAEETERSNRLSGLTGRHLAGRVILLDASCGDLAEYFDDPGRGPVRFESSPDLGTLQAQHGSSNGRPASGAKAAS